MNTAHTQTNTCPRCGKVTRWEVLVSIAIHDRRLLCRSCLLSPSAPASRIIEPADASGFADIEAIIIEMA